MLVTEAVILAGGRGTRLASVVPDLPKPMAPVGEKPFLHYLIAYLSGQGIRRIIISVGYRKEAIINFFGSHYLDCDIVYAEELSPLGTGGAVVNSLALVQGQYFWLFNGDTFFPVELSLIEKFHFENHADITLGLKKVADADRKSVV